MEGKVPQPSLHGLSLADIPYDAGQCAAREIPRIAEGHLHGRDAAILGHAEDLDRPLEAVRESVLIVDDEIFPELVPVRREYFEREEDGKFMLI